MRLIFSCVKIFTVAGRFTPNFACLHTLVPDVSSPLLGVSSPRGAEKWGNEIFVIIGVNGEFWREWRVCVSSTDALVLYFDCVKCS